jgi:hypothetical protein
MIIEHCIAWESGTKTKIVVEQEKKLLSFIHMDTKKTIAYCLKGNDNITNILLTRRSQ